MKNKRLLIRVGVILVIAVVAIGVYRNWEKSKKDNSLKIGAILPLTGKLAFIGEPEAAALRVAVKDINGSGGGGNIQLFIEDSKSEAKDAVAAARKLIDVQKVTIGLVSTSTLANAVAPVFQSSSIPLITICSDDTIPAKYDQAVNVYIHLETEQRIMSKYLEDQGIGSISAIHVNAEIAERGIQLLQKYGNGKLTLVNNQAYELGASDFKNIVTKIKGDKSQAIYVFGYGAEFPALVKTLREMGLEKKIFGNYAFLSDAARRDGTNLYQGIEFTTFVITPDQINNTPFGKQFVQALGRQPGPFMDYVFVYESVKIWNQMLKSGTQPKDFPRQIRGKTFESIFGAIEINSSGNAVVPMAIGTYLQNGSVEIKWKADL